MKIRKFDKVIKETEDLFDPEKEKATKVRVMAEEFKTQDEWAEKSEIFNRILQSEISNDPETRFKQTNSPKSKTRNALLSRFSYIDPETKEFDKEAWEKNLLTNSFYGLAVNNE